jgi:tRNA modification GTPase
MSYSADDEIVAIASATGGAARGILRLSGPRVARCLQLCFQADDALDQPRVPLDGHSPETVPRAIPGSLMLKDLGSRRLPCLLYYWATPHSYTRQPVAEFHTLGSPPLLDVALLAICASGARLANPGEFTMRAFLAGRLDMTQAEAVLGVIDAGGPQSLEVALAQLAGNLARPLHQLRERLLEVLAHLEAGLDFVEEDIQFIRPEVLVGQLTEAQTAVTDLLHRMDVRSYTPDSVQVVLMGAPNVGKSSLFNALAIEGEALTAATSGTTRDYLTASISLEGMDCQLVDTAGIED